MKNKLVQQTGWQFGKMYQKALKYAMSINHTLYF